MNTQEQLREAFNERRKGTFLRLRSDDEGKSFGPIRS